MGLSTHSVGGGVKKHTDGVWRRQPGERLIALAGNPNVGKSTLFNALTGLRQHTGNWPGKTVGSAYGRCEHRQHSYIFADLPGTYSLLARSAEEAVTRDALLYGDADAVVVVCDALCLSRSIQLALQIREIHAHVIVCVNLLDEAARHGLHLDLPLLQRRLGVPVIGMSAGRGEGLDALFQALETPSHSARKALCCSCALEQALLPLSEHFETYRPPLPSRWLALRCLEGDPGMLQSFEKHLGLDVSELEQSPGWEKSRAKLRELTMDAQTLSDEIAAALHTTAEEICRDVLSSPTRRTHRRIERLLTHPLWAWPAMFLLLTLVLWLTVSAANVPSRLLSQALFFLGGKLEALLITLHLPTTLRSFLCDGIYKTLAWVVSVMLPPMAIFFPLFTLLEDLGFLPRVAFHLDAFFSRCGSCGKQALTMCMGLGCNAAGVVGCRIIDSPRERLIAMLTNSFVPCNGRFPTLLVLFSLLFAGRSSLLASLALAGLIVLGILLTLLSSRLLSHTVLKGLPSSFALELPPFRKPKLTEILLRSLLDRSLFVLRRAVSAAAPAGAVIWLLANIQLANGTLLSLLSAFLDPLGQCLGLDGAVMLAFLLGLPANEIVLPVLLMCYFSGNSLMDYTGAEELGRILHAHGWTNVSYVCMLLFTLLHWPCATTLMTVKSESGRWSCLFLAALLPTVFGLLLCLLVKGLFG